MLDCSVCVQPNRQDVEPEEGLAICELSIKDDLSTAGFGGENGGPSDVLSTTPEALEAMVDAGLFVPFNGVSDTWAHGSFGL